MEGGAGIEVPETDLDRVTRWSQGSMDRWRELTEILPEDNGARLVHGGYTAAYRLDGDFVPPQGVALLEALRAGCVRHTGWPPFLVPTREGIEPYIYDGNVECWLAREGNDIAPDHSDYWRVSSEAEFFLRRGYQEDAAQGRGIDPGEYYELTTTIWRVGEILLHAASMAREFGDPQARVIIRVDWTGLEDRQLATYANPLRLLFGTHVSRQDAYSASLEVQADQLEDGLPELVHRLISPLYELFDFFQMPMSVVTEELEQMRSHRF